MSYFGWVGEKGKVEDAKIEALVNSYKVFLATVEDLLGIKSELCDDDLNENGELRYKIVDTKQEID